MHDKDRIEGTAKALAISRYLAAAMRSLSNSSKRACEGYRCR
jgi:hypothetical protein